MNGKSARLVLKVPRYFIFGIFLITLLALFLAPGAMAACNKKGKGKDCNPNQTPPTSGTSTAMFDIGSNIRLEDGSFLDCISAPTLSADNGHYNCVGPLLDAGLPNMHVTTDGFTGLFTNRFRDICGSLSSPPDSNKHEPAVLETDEVSYGWRDDCTDGKCRIEISMAFSGPNIGVETDDEADMLSILLGGWFYGKPGTEANPFLDDVIVTIDRADLEFRLTGKKRAVGICPFGVAPKDPLFDVNYVIFDSVDS